MQCVSTSKRNTLRDFSERQVVNVKAALVEKCWWLWPEPCDLLYVAPLNIYANNQFASHSRDISGEFLPSFCMITLSESCHCCFLNQQCRNSVRWVEHLGQGHTANLWLVLVYYKNSIFPWFLFSLFPNQTENLVLSYWVIVFLENVILFLLFIHLNPYINYCFQVWKGSLIYCISIWGSGLVHEWTSGCLNCLHFVSGVCICALCEGSVRVFFKSSENF